MSNSHDRKGKPLCKCGNVARTRGRCRKCIAAQATKQDWNTQLSEKQKKRMLKGRMESKPSDYATMVTEEGAKRRDARHRLEDMKMDKDLGIN